MRRILVNLITLLFGTHLCAAQQQILVPTRPAGDNTNAAASTAFVNGGGIGTGVIGNSNLAQAPAFTFKGNNTSVPATILDLTIAQIRSMLTIPVLVTDPAFGATSTTCNGASSDRAVIQAAINSLPPNGGLVLFPVGTCTLASSDSSIAIGNGNGTTASTVNGIKLGCVVGTRPGLNGISGTPIFGPCNISSAIPGNAIVVNGPINGWAIDGLTISENTTNTSANCLTVNSASFGTVTNFLCTLVPGIGIAEFINSNATQASYYNTWRNIQVQMLAASANAQGIHIGSGKANVDNFGDTWSNVNIIPAASTHTQLYIGSADSMLFTRVTFNPLSGSQALSLVYGEGTTGNTQWPSGIVFDNVDFGAGNNVSNTGTPGASARPNIAIIDTVNNGAIPNLANLAVFSGGNIVLTQGGSGNTANTQIAVDARGNVGGKGTAPTLTAGCNGAGSSVVGNNNAGTVVGQTAPATTCTLTFAGSGFNAIPSCAILPTSQAAWTTAPSFNTTTITTTFPSTANYSWLYLCQSIN